MGRVDVRSGATRCRFGLAFSPARGAPEQMARQFLRASASEMRLVDPDAELELVSVRQGLGTRHVRLRQVYRGLPVFGSDVVVSLHEDLGTVTAVASEYKPGLSLMSTTPIYFPQSAARMALAYLAPSGEPAFGPMVQLGAYSRAGVHRLAYRVEVVLAEPRGDWELFVDALNGEVISVRDRMCYVHGSGLIFNPDPITTSSSAYGTAGLTDNGDADSPQLTAERKRMPLFDITQVGLDFRLTGPYTTIFDFPGPDGAPLGDNPVAYQQGSPDGFNYGRADPGFEAAMVYGHITNLQYWIQLIGFTDVNNEQDPVDPHGLNGDENAFYCPTLDAMVFGEGGATLPVDFAEDAEVIVHEYAHAIQEDQVPGWGAFMEGRSMGEGFGDYLAGSYARWEGTYLDNWFAKWVASGTGPGLRPLNSTKMYPTDLRFEEHDDGEMWSACLWQIHAALGRRATDALVIQSHFYLTPGATFRDGALAILQADQDIHSGANEALIRGVFEARGILQTLPFALAAGANFQQRPAVAFAAMPDWGRNLLAVWWDETAATGRARLLYPSGSFAGPELSLGSIGYLLDVAFAPEQHANPQFLTVGVLQNRTTDVRGVLVSSVDGTSGPSLKIAADARVNESYPVVAAVDSTYLVAFAEIDDVTLTVITLKAQRIGVTGTLLGPATVFSGPANPPISTIGTDIAIGAGKNPLGEGQVLVTWPNSEYRGSTQWSVLRATRITRAGAVLDGTGVVLEETPTNVHYQDPAIAFDGTTYLIVYSATDKGPPFPYEVELRGVFLSAATGQPSAPFLIHDNGYLSAAPDVAFGSSQYLVVWQIWDGVSGTDIAGLRLRPDGSPLDAGPFVIARDDSATDHSPRVVSVGGSDSTSVGGGFCVVWEKDYPDYDVHGTFVEELRLPRSPPTPLALDVSVSGPSATIVGRGEIVLLPFFVTNTGLRKDAYRLIGSQSSIWDMEQSRDFAVLDPGEADTVLVELVVPATAADGESNGVGLAAISTTDTMLTRADGVLVTVRSTTSSPPDLPQLPVVLQLLPAVPNPSHGPTEIRFALPERSSVQLEIFSAGGQRVRSLAEAPYERGYHRLIWDGMDAKRELVATGIYFVRLHAGGIASTRRVVVIH